MQPGPALSNFQIGAISAGDIVFVYPRPARLRKLIVRFLNLVGQRILASLRKTDRLALRMPVRSFSHVMLGVGGGLIIHADGKTVAVEIVADALHQETNEAALFLVYRRRDISPDLANKIAKWAVRYYHQKYRFFSYFGEGAEGDTTQFCSRLVAHAYRAAGLPLATLPDHRVLPLDLYRICQSDSWTDISAAFVQPAPDPAADAQLGPIEIPGRGEMPLSAFIRHADALLRNAARLNKEQIELQYETTRLLLENEALLAKFCAVQFDISKKIRIAPDAINDMVAPRIARVLAQLDSLLALSLLPDIELLVTQSFLNTGDGQTDVPLYAGYLPPSAIHEMEVARTIVTIYTYLFFAETGLFTILAHHTPHEKFEPFRAVKREDPDSFLAALQPFHNFSLYQNRPDTFAWVDLETDRATCRATFANILAALQVIEILRNSQSRSTAGP
ncbi:MAG TPA: hypothetical protein VGK64_26300 [Bryobacteraceae bacterium]